MYVLKIYKSGCWYNTFSAIPAKIDTTFEFPWVKKAFLAQKADEKHNEYNIAKYLMAFGNLNIFLPGHYK